MNTFMINAISYLLIITQNTGKNWQTVGSMYPTMQKRFCQVYCIGILPNGLRWIKYGLMNGLVVNIMNLVILNMR